ncbi:GNAT family N-acetyltransferase [Ruegeria atlantica]|uniref:GNAT family N-acetyltransferase n=1 Tax=Ruegeria atlantica TaxID=81569 RepID=UPI0020C45A06|nr:GNAT family protein [Ruegeria atlantica]
MEPLDQSEHATTLFDAFTADRAGKMWTYMPVGPFTDAASFEEWMAWVCNSKAPMFFAIIDNRSYKAIGFASLMRIDPTAGTIEVGYMAYSPFLQKTPIATEAMHLLMRHVLEDLGYRRYEWKCDDLNAASKSAAERLGFQYDGLFRQALVYKGRNRDTPWFSVLDADWPRLRAAFETWLAPDNFDNGIQKVSLSKLTAAP